MSVVDELYAFTLEHPDMEWPEIMAATVDLWMAGSPDEKLLMTVMLERNLRACMIAADPGMADRFPASLN